MDSSLSNAAIADALAELGDLYELDGAIVHRVVAYRTAAQAVRDSTVSVAALARAGRAEELPGIGKTLQEKILALLQTGTIPAAGRLRAKYPPGLLAIMGLPGVGPKRTRLLHAELGIDSPEGLREAALAQRLRTVRGLGPKFEQNVLAALEAGRAEAGPPRVLLPRALEVGEAILAGLAAHDPGEARVVIAGSARRMCESVKDLDLIAATDEPEGLIEALGGLEQIAGVSSTSPVAARAQTHSGLGLDLRIGEPGVYGNLLQHFTGSGAHNAALRAAAVQRGLHVSEHGVLSDADGKTRRCASEEEVYALLGLAYIEPELRENRGELEAAALPGAGLPALIEESDIRGDLHCHTTASDGHASIEEMALAARGRGYEYLAITDHSASHGFGNDVSPEQLRRQIELVHEANARIEGIELLAGSEVNILPDGSMDYADELLGELDWVIASVHTAFGMDERAMTERMIAAIEHPLVDAIGHPTGRLIGRREPYAIDLGAVFAAAARTGTMLEINANPDRRDLSEIHARAARRVGAQILIDSDAHRAETLANIRWGVATARRAWLTAADVANTRPWPEFAAMRKRARG
ncbi:MAG TPA: DNA polymerase/3'-5' exonuclease PolX [Solirubrobacteraceae bacterium]|jgi:DNA polymerase (family 10)|nr:DNA polymerase/3'-5' exonuclease PolX [Solirubrobacteraceae bacterium]